MPAARAYFFTATGNAWPIGYTLKNPQFAATLRRIAAEGARGFYRSGRRGDRQGGGGGADRAGRHDARGSGRLHRQRAPAGLHRLSRIQDLRHGPAFLRRSDGGADAEAAGAVRPRQGAKRGAAAASAASHRGSREARLRRPQPLHGRPDFVAIPDGLLDPAYLAQRARADRSAEGDGAVAARRAAGSHAAIVRPRRDDRAPRHQPHLDHRRRWQRARDDDDHRRRVRLAQLGGGLPAQQRADGLLVRARPMPTDAPSPTRWGPASARAAPWRRRSCSTPRARS